MSSIKVTSNKRNRTFTIRTYINGKFLCKYRTIQFDKDEFAELQHNTENDWQYFLRHTYDYYKVQ